MQPGWIGDPGNAPAWYFSTCWAATMEPRPENCRYHSLWEWILQLYREVDPDRLAVKAAHARGMEIWGMGSLWDWGSGPDTPIPASSRRSHCTAAVALAERRLAKTLDRSQGISAL